MIERISFLHDGERIVLKVLSTGLFRVPIRSNDRYSDRKSVKYRNITAREVVKLTKSGDPVLTLKTGEKIRVFQGGDSSYMLSYPDGVIKKHDDSFTSRQKQASFSSIPDADSWYDSDW